jgi:hypothetical protein
MFDLFVHLGLRQDPVSSTVLIGGKGLQACVALGASPANVPSTVIRISLFRASGCCGLQSLGWRGHLQVSQPFQLVQCMHYALTIIEKTNKEESQYGLRCIIISYWSFCVMLHLLCTDSCFP